VRSPTIIVPGPMPFSLIDILAPWADQWGVSLPATADKYLTLEAVKRGEGNLSIAAAQLYLTEIQMSWRAQKWGCGSGRAHWRADRIGKAADRRRRKREAP